MFGGVADVLPYVGIFFTMGPAVVAALARGPGITLIVLVLAVPALKTELQERDDLGEREYERRTEGMPAEQAAAIAVEISDDRRREEIAPRAPSE